LTNDGNDFETAESTVIIEGGATDAEPASGLASVSINTGATNEGTLSSWRFTVDLVGGPNPITITATDNAGNTGQDSMTITYVPYVPTPDIRVSESYHDYNSAVVGTYKDWVLTIFNDGDASLSITDLSGLEATDFSIVDVPSLPITVAPAGSNDLTIRFAPSSSSVRNAILSIANNDLDENPTDVGLTGRGVYQSVVYVDANAIVGANNGLSWADAFVYLQDALAYSRSSGGDVNEIRVADGTYKPDCNSLKPTGTGDRTATFQLVNGVVIKGGYAGIGAADPNDRDTGLYETILTGDLSGDDDPNGANNDENCYHVVIGSGTGPNTVLDGFIITGGNADMHQKGGGMYNENGSPTLLNCAFVRNSAYYGGGINNSSSNPKLVSCLLTRNSADFSGGGGLRNENSSPTLINCRFVENRSVHTGGCGGGMANYNDSNPTLTNCVFSGNLAYARGGGIYNSNSNPTLINCTLTVNSAELYSGGGMQNEDSNPLVANCIFWGNKGEGAVENKQIYTASGTPVVVFSCIQDGDPNDALAPFGGESNHNIDDDPLFVDLGYWIDKNDANIVVEPNDPNAVWIDGVYQLLPGSPCIDAGDNSSLPAETSTDLGGSARFVDELCAADTGSGTPPIVDMGSYEYQGLLADLDNNCRVDFRDYAIFAVEWLNKDCSEPNWCAGADFDFDGAVDATDLAIVTKDWLVVLPVKLYDFALDSDPNWTIGGEWEFGQPTGDGGVSHGSPDPNNGYTGANVYGVNLNGDYSTTVGGPHHLVAGPFDFTGCQDAKLHFARWLNTDFPPYVRCTLEVSNNGITWQPVWLQEDGQTITDSTWQLMNYDISETADGQVTVYIRWSYQILDEQAWPYSGWNIDDIELWGYPDN
jgi:hypothetical protein